MQRLFKRKKRRHEVSEDISLNITAMADVFTVILVFLLKSFATGSINLTPTAGLVLPEAKAEAPNFEALKVEITDKAVMVEGEPVLALTTGYQFPKGDSLGNGTSKTLNVKLKKERDRQLLIAKSNSDVKIDPKILIVADQKVPYQALKVVLASAAVNGYTDFKLAVIKKE